MQYKLRILLICLFILSLTSAHAQETRLEQSPSYKLKNRHGALSFSAGVGISSYFGDLKSSRLSLQAKPSIQLGLQYRVNNNFHLRSEVSWYRISGADSLNDQESSIYNRNLSFRADNLELNVAGVYQLFNKYSKVSRPKLNPYGFIGLGITTVNPEAKYDGKWHKLRPLETEGEAYSRVALVVPFGLGLTYHVNNNWDISYELGYRYAFTDYLDDVSGAYVGVENFANPVAAALSDRRPERGLEPAPAGFKDRGNSSVKDWYMITGLKLTFTPDINYKRPAFR